MTYKCQNCGAPIDGVVCPYCKTRNAIDLKLAYAVYENPNRVCPKCDIFLETYLIDKDKNLYIEKCKYCNGIFLDFGELEEILKKEIVKQEKHDLKRLDFIKNHPLAKEQKISYKKCPQCRKMMHRLNYQNRSAVIIDRCRDHGYWLDGGELRQIMEWAKLEGVKDFTPLIKQQTTIKEPSKLYHTRNPKANFEFDPILGFFRKLYGF